VLAALHLVAGLLPLLAAVTVGSPLSLGGKVSGPPVLDTLALAYLLPAFVLAGLGWRLPGLAPWARALAGAGAAALAAYYAGLEIRRFWQGDDLSRGGVTDGELYSYTVAMLIASSATLYAAFARRSVVLRAWRWRASR
jgi:hypothetical protein